MVQLIGKVFTLILHVEAEGASSTAGFIVKHGLEAKPYIENWTKKFNSFKVKLIFKCRPVLLLHCKKHPEFHVVKSRGS